VSTWRETLPGLAPGPEEAAANVLPNGFQDNWFQLETELMSRGATRAELVDQLREMVPMCNEMDMIQLNGLVVALGAGLPVGY